MTPSHSARKLRERIEQAIEDHELSRGELEEILHVVAEDGYEDPYENALLSQLQQMIENKEVKVVP